MWPFNNVVRYDYLLSYLIVCTLTMNMLNFAVQPVAHCATIKHVPSVPRLSKNYKRFTSQLRGMNSIRESRIFFLNHCLGLVLLNPIVCVCV